MSLWLSFLQIATTAVCWVFLINSRWGTCRCGRVRMPWFHRQHERSSLMLVQVVGGTVATVSLAIERNTVAAVALGMVSVWAGRRWWVHEEERRKRLRDRVAGWVRVNVHGRLIIHPG